MPHSCSWATLLLRPWSQELQVLLGLVLGSQLPPVCVVVSAVSLSLGPHDAGHLLQQQAVVPVNDGEPLLLQLCADTQDPSEAPAASVLLPCTDLFRGLLQPHTSFDLSTLWVLHCPPNISKHCCSKLLQ